MFINLVMSPFFNMVAMDAAFVPIVIGLVVGAGAGALNAFLGWIKEPQKFDNRRFIYGIIVGIVTGLFATQAFIPDLEAAQTASELTKVLLSVVAAVIAVDSIRTAVTGAVKTQPASKSKQPTG